MNRRARMPVDVAGSLRRAHAALGEAILGLRRISVRGEEQSANRHRLHLVEAQVFEARYHLAAARSLLAIGLGVAEPAWVPRALVPFAQVFAARRAIRGLEAVRASIGNELQALARRTGDAELAARCEELPAERMPLPVAEALLYGGVAVLLVGIFALLAGFGFAGGAVVVAGLGAMGAAARALIHRQRG